MPKQDPRIDAYIIKSADFALPILQHLRALVQAACPDVEEAMKWSFPHFIYKGEILCSMASFKQHCAFGFWKASLMKDAKLLLDNRKEAMGSMGKITSLKDLPSDKKIVAWIKEAMKLTDAGAKLVKAKPAPARELMIPPYFSAALARNKKAKAAFEKFNYTHKKEYTEWLAEAKNNPNPGKTPGNGPGADNRRQDKALEIREIGLVFAALVKGGLKCFTLTKSFIKKNKL